MKASIIYASTIASLGIAWIGFQLIKNESKLSNRKLELEIAVNANSRKYKKRLLSSAK